MWQRGQVSAGAVHVSVISWAQARQRADTLDSWYEEEKRQDAGRCLQDPVLHCCLETNTCQNSQFIAQTMNTIQKVVFIFLKHWFLSSCISRKRPRIPTSLWHRPRWCKKHSYLQRISSSYCLAVWQKEARLFPSPSFFSPPPIRLQLPMVAFFLNC